MHLVARVQTNTFPPNPPQTTIPPRFACATTIMHSPRFTPPTRRRRRRCATHRSESSCRASECARASGAHPLGRDTRLGADRRSRMCVCSQYQSCFSQKHPQHSKAKSHADASPAPPHNLCGGRCEWASVGVCVCAVKTQTPGWEDDWRLNTHDDDVRN